MNSKNLEWSLKAFFYFCHSSSRRRRSGSSNSNSRKSSGKRRAKKEEEERAKGGNKKREEWEATTMAAVLKLNWNALNGCNCLNMLHMHTHECTNVRVCAYLHRVLLLFSGKSFLCFRPRKKKRSGLYSFVYPVKAKYGMGRGMHTQNVDCKCSLAEGILQNGYLSLFPWMHNKISASCWLLQQSQTVASCHKKPLLAALASSSLGRKWFNSLLAQLFSLFC